MSHGEGEEESDIFAIREVSFQPEGDSEWKETSYTLNTDSLDWVRAAVNHEHTGGHEGGMFSTLLGSF